MFLIGAALTGPTIVLAQSLQRELVYQIAYGNVTLGAATIELFAGGPDYRIRLQSLSDGPLRIFARWHNEGETTGRRVTGALHLLHHERRGDWGGDRSFLRMTVDGEGAVDIISDPPEEPAKTALLLERAGPLLLDPYSAVLALLYEIERGGTCQAAVRAFDGRRLTDVELVDGIQHMVPIRRLAEFAG